jgi:hypothetical protein
MEESCLWALGNTVVVGGRGGGTSPAAPPQQVSVGIFKDDLNDFPPPLILSLYITTNKYNKSSRLIRGISSNRQRVGCGWDGIINQM